MLKIIFITAALFATFAQTTTHSINPLPQSSNPAEEWLLKILENIRNLIKGGMATVLPKLDPLHVGSFHLSSGMLQGLQHMINLTGDVNDIVLEGLSGYNVTKIELNLLPPYLEARGIWPRIRISGNHALDGKIASWVPFHGHGPFSAGAYDILVAAKAELGLQKGFKVFVDDVKISLNVTRFEFKMLNGGGLMDEMANNLIASSVKTIFDATVHSKLNDLSLILKNYLNKLIA